MFNLRRFPLVPSALLVLCLAAPPAGAGISFTTDQTTFNAAALASGTTISTQSFNGEGIATNGYRLLGSTLSMANDSHILPGLSFATTDGSILGLYGPNTNAGYNSAASNTNTLLSTFNYNEPIVINFSLPQSAVSLSLLGLNLNGTTLVPTIVTVISTTGAFLGDYSDNLPIAGTGQFLGITTTGGTQIGEIALSVPTAAAYSNYINIESVGFRQGIAPSVVPEPGSLALVTIALAGLGCRHARQRRRVGPV